MKLRIFICLALVVGFCSRVFAADGSDEEFRFARSLAVDQEEYELAAKKFEAYVQERPGDTKAPEALRYLGMCYGKLKQNEKAAQAYVSMLSRYPTVKPEWRQQAMKYAGDYYYIACKYASAAEFYGKLLDEYPTALLAEEALLWRGQSYDKISLELADKGDAARSEQFARMAVDDFLGFSKRYPASKHVTVALRQAGVIELESGKYKPAVEIFSRLVAEYPNDSSVGDNQYDLAECFYRRGDFVRARGEYAKVLNLSKSPSILADARSNMAWCDYKLGIEKNDAEGRNLLMDAVKGLAEVEALAGKDAARVLQAKYDSGQIYSHLGMYDKAVSRFSEVLQADGKGLGASAMVQAGIARVEQAKALGAELNNAKLNPEEAAKKTQDKEQYLGQAIEWLKKALDNPEIKANAPEAATLLADAYLDLKKYEDAAGVFEMIARKWPEDERAPFALFHLAYAKRELNQLVDAVKAIQQLLASYPDSPLILKAAYVMGDYQAALGKKDKSLKAYRFLAEKGVAKAKSWKGPDGKSDPELIKKAMELAAESLLRLGEDKYLNSPTSANVAEFYDKVLAEYPGSEPAGMARLRLAEIAESQKKYQDAVNYYAEILKGAQDGRAFQPALFQLAVLQFTLSQSQQGEAKKRLLTGSLNYLNRFVEGFPRSQLLGQVMHYRGEVLYAMGNIPESISSFEKSLKLAPDGRLADAAYYNVGWGWRELKNPEKSIKAFDELVSRFAKSSYRPEVLYLLAVDKHLAEDYAGAVKALDALANEHADSEYAQKAMIRKGRVLIDTNRAAEAVTVLEGFIKAYPDSGEKVVAMDNLAFAYASMTRPEREEVERIESALAGADGADKDSLKKKLDESRQKLQASEGKVISVFDSIEKDHADYAALGSVLLRHGEVLYDRREFPAALEKYSAALELVQNDPVNSAAAKYRIAWCNLRLSEKAQAEALKEKDPATLAELNKLSEKHRDASLAAFEKLIGENPDSALSVEALFRAAELKRTGNDKDKAGARSLYEKYLAVAKPGTDTFAAKARFGSAVCLLDEGKSREALDYFKAAVAKTSDKDVLRDLNWGAGQAALNLQAYVDAEGFFLRALEGGYAGVAAAKSRYGLGMIELSKQNWEKAREEFLKVDAFHGQWREVAAMALLKGHEAAVKMGKADKAEKDLKRIVERYAGTKAASKAAGLIKK